MGVLKRPMVFQADDEGGQIFQAQRRSSDRDDRVLEIEPDAVDRDARRDCRFQITEEPGPGKRALGDQVVGKDRSEEHTSELQSQSNLVCRLLLEKKKNGVHADYGIITEHSLPTST